MAHHRDAEKRHRQAEIARERNRHYRSRMRTQIRKLSEALQAADLAAVEAAFPETVSVIQRVAQKGVIHRSQAARRVSRLAAQVNALRKAAPVAKPTVQKKPSTKR